MQTVQASIDYIGQVREGIAEKDPELYRLACVTLAEDRDDLTQSVYITVPGGDRNADDPLWSAVLAGSESLCSCGTPRVIRPGKLRKEFEPSESEIVFSFEHKTYLRPIGGDKSSALLQLTVVGERLTILEEPFRQVTLDFLFSGQPGANLTKIAKAIETGSKTQLVHDRKTGQPIFTFKSVDLQARTVTVTLDRAIEAFDPETEEEHQHHA